MQIKYTNAAGQELILEAWPRLKRFVLQDWEGFGAVEVSLQMRQSPYQDGVTVMQELLEPRHLSLEIALLGESKQEVYNRRRFIQNLFNPKLGLGRLEWLQPDGKVYVIEVLPDGSPSFPGGEARTRYSQTVVVELMAPDPAWQDLTEIWVPLARTTGLLKFPLELPTEFGQMTYGERTVINDGDMAAPVSIVFEGPVANPSVENKTAGKRMKIMRALELGDKLIVDTTFGKKKVLFIDEGGHEQNAFGDVDLESSFWWLEVGENHLSYTADEGLGAAYVQYKQRYVGV